VTDISEQKLIQRQLQQHEERLRALSLRLTQAQLEERRLIALGLHDDVGQLLTAGLLSLGELRKTRSGEKDGQLLEELENLLMQASDRVRNLTFELSSSTLREVGLGAALEELAEQMEKRFGLPIAVKLDRHQEAAMPESVRLTLYCAVRELLFNVVKHAKARRAVVRLDGTGKMIRVVVEDDGRGFEVRARGGDYARGGGYGLFRIHEELAAIGGSVSIASRAAEGTRVTLEAPLPPAGNPGGAAGEDQAGRDARAT